jgi:putative addiction module component (TIGR02574 family)
MRAHAVKVLEEALRLPVEARAAIAGRLLESLDETIDEDAEVAWSKEIARRVEDLESGRATTVSWAEARALILGEQHGSRDH